MSKAIVILVEVVLVVVRVPCIDQLLNQGAWKDEQWTGPSHVPYDGEPLRWLEEAASWASCVCQSRAVS